MHESWLRPFRAIKYKHEIQQITKTSDAAFAVASWFGGKIREYPKFLRPETMIEFRNSVAKESFLNCVVREYIKGRGSSDPTEAVERLGRVLDKNLALAREIASDSYRRKSQLLSGLFATLGGLLGGVPGAIAGGVGANMAVLAAEELDRKRVGRWASFFLE